MRACKRQDVIRQVALAVVMASFAGVAGAANVAEEFSPSRYADVKASKGTVLVSVNWGRKWQCGRFENAQLKSLSFDKVGAGQASDEAEADWVLEDSFFARSGPQFKNYVFLMTPGEYLLSGFDVKVATSVSEVGHHVASRSHLVKDGQSKGGSFTVAAGEAVYIGHFFIDCAHDPIPWRYYPEDRAGFDAYLRQIGRAFEGLEADKVQFRLFSTTEMGNPFTLD